MKALTQSLRDSPEARIIILTSYDGDEDIYAALQAGAKSYVLKDTSIEDIVDVIHTVHLGGRGLSLEIGAKLAARICRSDPTFDIDS
ncbi:MAG: hypothetical protein J2P31_08530 [Blastocatellia bacterium]|nr:hypothetical protein [Blastocatellia bacterium]